jgi:tRNA threonylcarbamoyladenosine biosynthesis protein TsaB
MLLIAIDTSGRHGSVALCRGEQGSFETMELVPLEGGTYSARLMPTIAELLARQRITKEQVDAFVVVSGPGSFTGLRVGISTAKGLAEVLGKPLVAVTMLEAVALAQSVGRDALEALKGHGLSHTESEPSNAALAAEGIITVALDAGRGEVYVGDFTLEHSHARCIRQYVSKLDSFASGAASHKSRVLTPDSRVADALQATGADVQQVAPVRADDIGRLGLAKLLAGDVSDPETLDASYIRRSDAEIFGPPKR